MFESITIKQITSNENDNCNVVSSDFFTCLASTRTTPRKQIVSEKPVVSYIGPNEPLLNWQCLYADGAKGAAGT